MPSGYTWTYFIKDLTSGLVKIGRCSVGVHKRLREMQATNPNLMTIIGAIEGDHERVIHRELAHLRRHREWFECTPELLDLVEQRRSEIPDALPDGSECCTVCRRKAVIGTGLCRYCKPRKVAP